MVGNKEWLGIDMEVANRILNSPKARFIESYVDELRAMMKEGDLDIYVRSPKFSKKALSILKKDFGRKFGRQYRYIIERRLENIVSRENGNEGNYYYGSFGYVCNKEAEKELSLLTGC